MLCACDGGTDDEVVFDNKYNAVLFSSSLDRLNDDYIAENSTKYSDDKYVNQSDPRPTELIKIINNEQDFQTAFKSFPTEIDFAEEMLVLYFFTAPPAVSAGGTKFYENRLIKTDFADGILKIEVESKSVFDDSMPRTLRPEQQCFIIKMDKLNVDETSLRLICK